ncbi:MAG: TIGR04290 family methyltransferase [Sumerlaeia bacterium]
MTLPIQDAPEIEEEIEALGPWFHNLHLPCGMQTAPSHPLGDFPAFKWAEISPSLPENLSGWTALDIGCNAGFYTFELARRGARVTAIDLDPHYLRQARWAAQQFGVEGQVEFRRMQVYELAREPEDLAFDLVLFMGVFYHLRYPVLGLDAVARRTRRLMVFQTLTMPGEEVESGDGAMTLDDRGAFLRPGWPKMAYMEHGLCNDPTNRFAANHAAVEALLRSAGLRVRERPGHEIYVCEPDASLLLQGEMARIVDEEYAAASGAKRPNS